MFAHFQRVKFHCSCREVRRYFTSFKRCSKLGESKFFGISTKNVKQSFVNYFLLYLCWYFLPQIPKKVTQTTNVDSKF